MNLKHLEKVLVQGNWLSFHPCIQHLWQSIWRRLLLAARIFMEERMNCRAGSLTYSFLLALVPVLALIFAIAKGFGLDSYIVTQIHQTFSTQPQVVDMLLGFANRYLLNTSQGVFVGIGIIMLFYTIWSLLSRIELTFNQIWQVKEERTLLKQIKDYVFASIFFSIFLIVSTGLSFTLSKTLEVWLGYVPIVNQIPLLWVVPFILMVLFFTMLYSFMPNSNVSLKSAFVAGLPVGILIQMSISGYIYLQIVMTSYNAIYGSLAALPLIMIWVQILWFIILFGTALSYADQNVDEYEFPRNTNYSHTSIDNLIISICVFIFQRFKNDKEAPTIKDIQKEMKVPLPVLSEILRKMMYAKIILMSSENHGYVPACDLDLLTIGKVLKNMDELGDELLCETKILGMKEFKKSIYTREFANNRIVDLLKDEINEQYDTFS